MARLACFPQGLATNLYRLGVKDKVIQAILRHSNLSATMNAYVKLVNLDATAAMRTLEAIYATSGRIADNRVAVKKPWHF